MKAVESGIDLERDAVPRFGEVAALLAENGYQPLPVHFKRKNPSAGNQWQNYVYREADSKRFSNDGTGILCGEVVGLDIDVRDEKLANKLDALAEETFGPAPRRIGQPPKVLRMLQAEQMFSKMATHGYRLPGDDPEDKTHRVEILAKGQQFVAFNIHPDTGKPYTWNGAGDPRTVPIGLLPTISEAQARDYIAAADRLLAQHGRAVGRLVEADETRLHAPSEQQRAADPAVLRQALAALPNAELEFDDWMRVLYAVKGALGEAGAADFLKWSAKAVKDSPQVSAHEYRAARPTKIGAGSVFFLAERAGWVRPSADSVGEPWPDPVNLFAELVAAPYCTAEVPVELGEYPQLFSEQTGIDVGVMLTAAVASAAAAIPDQIQICGASASNWFAQPRLWVLVIGAPGAGKSPGQREMLKPLWRLHSDLDSEWRTAMRDVAEGDPKPARPRVVLGDVTLEALSDVLVDNPRGVLVATDEFDAWLGAMDQYKSGGMARDRGEWLRLFDGGPHSIERVRRGSVFVPNWGVSILTATTPAAIQRLARHLPEDGLIQRFLVVVAQRQKLALQARPRSEVEGVRDRYAETISRLWDLRARSHQGIVPLSVEATERFDSWRVENLDLQEALGSLDPALEGHVAKYPMLALRLALVFHCAQVVNKPEPLARDPAAFPVSLGTLELALAFLNRASKHALSLYLGRRGGSPAYELARQVARFILARSAPDNARGLQRRDALRHVSAFKKAEDSEQMSAMRLLGDLGWTRPAEGGYQKAQPTRFDINPALQRRFTEMAERERARRALVRERIAESSNDRRQDSNAS